MMTASPKFSTSDMPRRRRSRLHVDEALKIDAIDLAPTIRLGDGAEDQLRWPLVGVRLNARVVDGDLLLTGGPAEARIKLLPVQIAHGRRWWMFACPTCGVRRRRLYLPYGRRDWECRRCHRLVARRVPNVDVYRIAAEVERLQGQVRRLDYVRRLRQGPVVGETDSLAGDDGPDPKALRQEVAAVRKYIERLSPPGV